jgi:hypothetical protein
MARGDACKPGRLRTDRPLSSCNRTGARRIRRSVRQSQSASGAPFRLDRHPYENSSSSPTPFSKPIANGCQNTLSSVIASEIAVQEARGNAGAIQPMRRAGNCYSGRRRRLEFVGRFIKLQRVPLGTVWVPSGTSHSNMVIEFRVQSRPRRDPRWNITVPRWTTSQLVKTKRLEQMLSARACSNSSEALYFTEQRWFNMTSNAAARAIFARTFFIGRYLGVD